MSKKKMERNNGDELHDFTDLVKDQVDSFDKKNYGYTNDQVQKHHDLIRMLLMKQDAFLTENNKIDLFTDGHEIYDKVLEDIYNAKDYLHLEYYTFELDGLEVNLLYDDVGSKKVRLPKFKHFRSLGGEVEAFFPSKLPLINFRMNNRNQRKIIIIDGQIGYIGGFNVGDDYLGLGELGYWRDTHTRIQGEGIDALQLRFILDWNSQSHRPQFEFDQKYFPKKTGKKGDVVLQIASSGPAFDLHQIEYGYTKMIMSARKSIYLQSPYFIPDQSYINALKMAANNGVDVNLMIPCKPDYPFVYWATFSNAADLLDSGVNIYTYQNEFIHSKILMIDDEVSSIGSANMDFRSFELNFEVNAYVYDKVIAKQLREAFEEDITKSNLLTKEKYENRPLSIKFKEDFAK